MKQEKEDCIMKFGTDCFVYSSFDHNYENPSYRKEKKLEFEIWRNPGSRILQVEVCRRMTDNIYLQAPKQENEIGFKSQTIMCWQFKQ
jgi:hypothetical protein